MRRLVVAIVVAGCGDNIPTIELGDYAIERRDAECSRLVRCGLFAETGACTAFFRDDEDASLLAAIAANKIRYDAASARPCLDALAEQACDLTSRSAREIPVACLRVFTGRLGDDVECAFDDECMSGSCSEPTCPRDMCCVGLCEPTIVDAAIDAACTHDEQCVAGASCGKDGACHALGLARDPCDRDAECDFELACIGATELMRGVCRDLPAIGEPCPYLRCAEASATCASGTCVAVGLPGSPCAIASECSPYGQCDAITQRCTDLPALGMPCTIGCVGDAWCNAGTCAALVPENEPCTASNQCASGFCAEGPVFDYCAVPAVCS